MKQSGNQLLAIFMLRCNISPAFSQVACTLLSVTCSPSKGNAETRTRLVLPSWISYSSLWQNVALYRVSCYRFNRLLHFRKCFAPLCLQCFRAVFLPRRRYYCEHYAQISSSLYWIWVLWVLSVLLSKICCLTFAKWPHRPRIWDGLSSNTSVCQPEQQMHETLTPLA